MSEPLQRIVPNPPPPAVDEFLAPYQYAGEFYTEVRYRQDFERHCQWYYATAEANRREFEKMRGDINILGWLTRRR